MMLEASHISVTIAGKAIVRDISFTVEAGETLMLIGPNGAGKTTLIRAMMRGVPHTGDVILFGKEIGRYKPAELARKVGVLTQQHNPQFAYSVREVVSLGRFPYRQSMFAPLTAEDKHAVESAMQLTGVDRFGEASIQHLSGGELQRVFLAQLLAQDPDLMILDEPTNNLDLSYQIALFDIIGQWVKQGGKAVIAVIHDLNMVYRYATKALLMKEGACHAIGTAEEVLSAENLNQVYRVDVASWMKGLLQHWEKST